MRAHEFESQDLPSVERARRAIPQILARAQRDYDAWDETDRDTYAGGGICHIIADSVCDVLSDAGIECTSVSCSYEQHVYVAARFAEGIYTIDIPYHVYEQGGGFSWKKLPDVRFEPRDVVFYRVSGDPADWRDYLDEQRTYQQISERVDPAKLRTGWQDQRQQGRWLLQAHGEDDQRLIISVRDSKDPEREVGFVRFVLAHRPQDREPFVRAGFVFVNPEYRGQGLARLMYQYANDLGQDIEPSASQTEKGQAMWKKMGGQVRRAPPAAAPAPRRSWYQRLLGRDPEPVAEGLRNITNFVRNIGSDPDAPIVMMTNPQNTGARTASGQRMRIEDFPLRTVAVSELKPWEPMIKMRDLPSQRTVASLTRTLQQGGRIPPLLVTPVRGGYRIIDGHHRYAALQRAGIDQAPVRVVDPRLIRYSDEIMEALKITLERYGHLAVKEQAGEERSGGMIIRWQQVTPNKIMVQARSGDGREELGSVQFYRYDPSSKKWTGEALHVSERHRRQGVATAMYDWFRQKFGPIRPSDAQTRDGKSFWQGKRVWEQGVAEGSENLSYIGNCTDDDVIEHIFGDATNFAQAVEDYGDEFTIGDLVVKYDPESDVHSFYYKKQGVAEGIDPDTFEDLDARIIARAAKRVVPTARARRTPEGYVHVTTPDGLDLYIGASVADGSISVNIGSGGGVTTSGAHKGAVTDIIRGVYLAAVRKYGEPDTPGELTIDHDAGHGVWQHIADKLGLRYAAVEVKESGMAEGRISDLDQDLQDQQWEAVVGRVQHGVRRGEDPDGMSLALYQWAADEMFDVDEELERRGFDSVADLWDHIRDHGGRYVPPEFDLGAGGSIKDIERMPRRRPDDVSEATSEPDFMRGHCHVMALALLTLHPDWQLRAHIGWDEDAESDNDYRVDHVYVVAPDGTAFDCRGRFASEQELVGPDETGDAETQFVDYDISRMRADVARGELRPFSRRDLKKARAFAQRMDENFADGKIKGKSRPGRVRRAGASCQGSVTDLRARARKYGGERGKMYHWCANMKSGRKK